MKRIAKYCSLLVVASGFAPAAAQDISSAYTKLDVRRDCKHRPGTAIEDYGEWRCKGHAGAPMWLGAGDQRMYVSFGAKAKDEPAAGQTLAPFNDFYKGVVEWRLSNGKPFAGIMRWNVKRAADMENREIRGRALVVTRLPPGAVCHVGYVDALANPNANELAREIADRRARDFVCGVDTPVVLGKITPGEDVFGAKP
ncbi:MAG: hypothetical protein AB7F41_08190 [Methylocystis sp.]|uniref:hypothetical protein n=1 Tax=Methylocystis sp. TaxID=1911079 RepID=UPI003D124068